MKKFLSLVLALVMVMSLVTISAGAKDFADDSDITYKEAVDVISAIGVVGGYADGTFRPEGNLTRGAAAKIICNLILGPTTASALVATTAPFSDVPTDNVFAGYIAFCAQQGIISGYSDGTFRPADGLSTYAFMKMLLGALGYDASIEGYVGANWSIQVAKRALNIGLDDGLEGSLNGTAPVTREEACLYAFNTLKATMVDYDSKTTVSINGAEVVVGGSNAKEVPDEGDKHDTIKSDEKLQFAEKYFTKLKLTEDTSDNFGRPASKWTYDSKSVGTYTKTPDLTYTKAVEGGDIWADLGEPDSVTCIGKAGVKGNYMVDGLGTKVPAGFAVEEDNDEDIGGKGTLTEVYYDDDAKTARIVVINTYLAQATDDYDEDDEVLNIEVKNSAFTSDIDLDIDDFDVADYKENDYLLVTATKSAAGDWTIRSVAPAEVVENVTVSAYKATTYVTADGTKYEFNATIKDKNALGNDKYAGKWTLADKGYNLILDQYGYVIGAEGYTASTDVSDYLFLKDAATSGFNVIAKVVFSDGTSKTITISETATAGGELADVTGIQQASNKQVGNQGLSKSGLVMEYCFYTYNVDSNGEYELTAVNKADRGYANAAIANGSATPIDGVNIKATNDTVFIAKSSVYTGVKNAPDVKASDVYYVLDEDGDLLLVYTGTAGVNSTDVEDYVFLFDSNGVGKDEDDNTYYIYDAVVDGVKTTLNTADKPAAAPGLFKIETYTDGYANVKGQKITASTDVVTVEGSLSVVKDTSSDISYKSGVVSTKANNFVLDDDVVIYNIDTSEKTVKTITESALNKLATGTYTVYAIQASSSDTTVEVLYIVH